MTFGLNKSNILNLSSISGDQLQAYIAEIQSIKNADYGDFGALQMQEYANALSELKPTQAAVLLSTQGLTNAQIQQTLAAKGLSTEMQYQAMAEAGLLSSSTKLTNTKLQSVLATQLESDAKAEEVMTSMGLTVAKEGEDAVTVKLTAKKLQEAVASGVLTEAQAQELAMTLGVTTATNAQAASVIPAWITKMKAMTAAVWAQVKATAVWLATNPAGWAILGATAIYGISRAVSHYNKKQEEAKQKIKELGETAKQSADEIKSSFEQTKSSVDDIAPRYAELAQQVQNLGKATQNQGYLSNDDYQEFLDLSNQLAELFPQLTSGYDSNGNAILKLDGSIQNITTSIYSYVDALERANSVELQEKFGDIWNSNKQDFDDYSKQAQEAQDNFDNLQQTYQRLQQILSSDSKSGTFDVAGGLLPKIFENADIALTPLIDQTNGGYDFSELSDKEIIDIQNAYSKMLQEYKDDVEYFTSQVDTTNKNTADYIISSLQGDRIMQSVEESFGEDGVNIINGILSNLDYGNLFEGMSGEDIIEQIKKDYLFKLSNLDDTDKTAFKEAWNNLLAIDPDAALSENIPKIEEYIKQIAELLGIDWTKLASDLGYDQSNKLKEVKNRMGFAQEGRNLDVNRKINDFTADLTSNDVDLLLDVEIPKDILNYTKEEFDEWLEKLREEAKDGVKVRTALETATDLKASDEAMQKLGSASEGLYADVKAGKKADASDVADLSESFGNVSNGLSLEKLAQTLQQMPGDVQAAQKEIDNLTTAFYDQSNVLDDITDENADYIKQQLKMQGVTNAEEFVQSRLNLQTKENIKAINKYSNAVGEYAKTLLTTQQGEDGYDEALEGIRSNFETLYNSINNFKDGDETITIPISTEFAQQNLQDLIDAANGSSESLDRLQVAAAKEYVMNMTARFPADIEASMNSQMNSLMDTIQGQVQDVEVGAYLDDTQAINALNNLIRAAGGTTSDVNNVLSQMGVDAEVIKQSVPMEQTGRFIDQNGHPHTTRYKQNVEIASIRYKRRASGGTGAHYGGSSSKSSGGSGGGGGSSSDNQPETFDWIEVAINRAEEQISRLDKVVGNTYAKWTNRSKALNDEISKTSNEIKLQQQAYQGYMNKANSIGLSNDYKKKVQNGTIQIETIKDENLAKRISDYQTWYNKAIACKDAIQDLNINLSQLAKQKFDNVVKQFEELEQVFSDANDIVQARVDNTKTKGYLESKSYYKIMMNNEKKNYNTLVNQRKDMVAKFNEAVKSGAIKVGSEEYNSMKSQIDQITASIVKSNTTIKEFANNIRQIDWDLFDLGQTKISNVADEIDFLGSLLDDKDNLTDGNRNRGLTSNGYARMGTHAINYNTYMEQAKQYANEIKKLDAQIAKDPANQDLINRKEELVKAQRDVILSANDERKSMIDLARDGYDAVLDSMQKLIDKKKEALSSIKELYEYQKSIAEKTKNLANLEKQYDVYKSDDSEEAKKKIQQLKVSIDEAKQDLKDTEYDKYIEDQEKMLDDLYQEYSDKIDEKFENTDALISELITLINNNSKTINTAVSNAVKSVGYTMSTSAKTVFAGSKQTVSNFANGTFKTYSTNVQTAIKGILAKVNYMSYLAWKDSQKSSLPHTKPKTSSTSMKKYAGGLKEATYDHLAWTQEEGAEIIRRSDGSILTPITRGTTVFTREMTDNLWNIAKQNPEKFYQNAMPTMNTFATTNRGGDVSVSIGDIKLDGIQNPDQFAQALIGVVKDYSKVQKVLQAATVDLVAGKSIKDINRF